MVGSCHQIKTSISEKYGTSQELRLYFFSNLVTIFDFPNFMVELLSISVC